MPPFNNYKEAWLAKAKVDYFAPFISLWLACNSWYRSHYSDLTAYNNPNREALDRVFINKLKTDYSRRNHIYKNFENSLLGSNTKKTLSFKTTLELLQFSLSRAELKPERLKYKCSLEHLLIDYSKKEEITAYNNAIILPRINTNGLVHKDDIKKVIKLDTLYIINEPKVLFAGLFELIYQVRNMVIHGYIKPDKEEHEVVKYCYLILLDLIEH